MHIDVLIYLREALRDYFRNEPQVYVAGHMLLYYEEGNPTACVAPDVFVVQGVTKGERRTYKFMGRRPTADRGLRDHLTWIAPGRFGHQAGPLRHVGGARGPFCTIRWASICGRRYKATGCCRANASAWLPGDQGELVSQALSLELRLQGGQLQVDQSGNR